MRRKSRISYNMLDEVDRKILEILQEDATISLEEIGKRLKMSKTAIHYRINRLKSRGIIKKIAAIVDPSSVGYDLLAVSLIKAKYAPGYQEIVGEKLSKIKGVWGVYFTLGDIDYIVLIRAKDRGDLQRIVNEFINIPEIERSSTIVVLKRIKEDFKVEL